MSQEPSPTNPYASLSIAQLVGLQLARLYALLVRMEASGERRVPADIARMVISTEGLVHAFIRVLAAEQLKHAGFIEASNAMREPVGTQAPPALTFDVPHTTPAALLARLETSIQNFEQAEKQASHLARLILCALLYVSPEPRSIAQRFNAPDQSVFSLSNPPTPSPAPWPPPLSSPSDQRDPATGKARPSEPCTTAHPCELKTNPQAKRRRSPTETKSRKRCDPKQKRRRDLSAALKAHPEMPLSSD